MHKPLLAAALAALLLISGAASAQIQTPLPQPAPRLPDGVRPILPCGGAVDLAITSVSIYKLTRPGDVRVEFDVYNLGPGAWNSGPRQQVANLVVHNGNTGRDYTLTDVPIGERRYGRGVRVGRVVSTPIRAAFDTFEFSGWVQASLAFDPDGAIDGNVCNDDANAANNTFRVEPDAVHAFLASSARSQTFRR